MKEFLALYQNTILALGVMGTLFLIQLLVADIAGILSRHIPGAPVEVNHRVFLFRATRAHANTNESIAGFVLGILFCLLMSASPWWVAFWAWCYVGGRVGHMLCYYADLRILRAVFFALSFVSLFVLFFVGVLAWLR